jgi:hypothetical protein
MRCCIIILATFLFTGVPLSNLKGVAITDEQNYFLALKPRPFPEKPIGTRLKEDLKITLSNNEEYSLKHFDNRYLDYDTSLLFLYVIPEKLLPDFRKYEVENVKMMMGDEGERVYTFKLHKTAIKDQLNCLIENLERSRKGEGYSSGNDSCGWDNFSEYC